MYRNCTPAHVLIYIYARLWACILYNNHNLHKLWGNLDQTAHSQRNLPDTPDNTSVLYAESNQTAHNFYHLQIKIILIHLQVSICNLPFWICTENPHINYQNKVKYHSPKKVLLRLLASYIGLLSVVFFH